MPSPSLTPREALEAIDSRHDELIRKLDVLNAQIEVALKQFAVRREAEESDTQSTSPAQVPRTFRKAA
jgi:hypothetical protein